MRWILLTLLCWGALGCGPKGGGGPDGGSATATVNFSVKEVK